MSKYVLDASAILALLNQEPGHELVAQHLPNSILSAVNFSEIISVLVSIGISDDEAEASVAPLLKEIIPFDQEQALIAASLRKITKPLGLSLGDRACLALAKTCNASVLTADKAWAKLKDFNKIILIR